MKQGLLKKLASVAVILGAMLTTAKAQSAINLDGTNNEATAAYNFDLTNGFTVEYNMYIDDFNYLVGGVTGTNSNIGDPLDTYIDGSGTMTIFIGDGNNYSSGSINNFFTTGQWYNIAITYDPNTTQAYVYVNGVIMSNFAAGNVGNAGNLIIGSRSDDVTNGDAKFSKVLIWSGARNTAQVAADQATCFTGTEAGLQVYYNMGEVAGTTLHNLGSAGSAANATINGTFSWINGYKTSSIAATAINTYYSPSGKYVWTKNGTYTDTISSKNGCHDSIVHVKLTLTHRMYVNGTPSGFLNNGISWANAYYDFGNGVDSSKAGDTIFVAATAYGYKPSNSYTMKDSVKIYGGFAGTESGLSQRNLNAGNTTILSGSNIIRVIDNRTNHLTPAAVLDGFTIANGYSHGQDGGGMADSNSSPTLSNLTFLNNNSDGNGGGISNKSKSYPVLTNVIFSGNNGSINGGAIYQDSGTASVTNGVFYNNDANNTGGSVQIDALAKVTMTNCTFSGSYGGVNGGGIENDGALTLTNSVFWNCNGSGTQDVNNTGTLTESYNYTQTALGGINDVVGISDPFIADGSSVAVLGTDGILGTTDDGLHLDPTNGVAAIGTGNVSAVPAGIFTDISNTTLRVQNGKVDMGAYASGCITSSSVSVHACGTNYMFTSAKNVVYTETTPGNYIDTIKNKALCDSLVHINLTFGQSNTGDTIARACQTFTWYGNTYTTSGSTATKTLTNKSGCDSVVTLHLTIGHPTTGDTTVKACDQFTWYGNTYTASGTPTQTLIDKEGCDSVLTLHLTIHNSSNNDTIARVCGSFKWYGNTYTSSGDYSINTTTNYGCDSSYKMHLIINNGPTQSAINIGTYASSYKFKGTNETVSGHYTFDTLGVYGCDSVINLYLKFYAKPVLTTSSTCPPANLTLSGSPMPGFIQWQLNGSNLLNDTIKWDTGKVVAQDRLDNNIYTVAVDTAGNVYVGDNTEVLEYPKGASAGTPGVVVAENGIQGIDDVRLDIAGNIFVADYNLDQVLEFPVGSDSTTVPTVVASGLGNPDYLFVDNADNIYISDNYYNAVVYYPAGSPNSPFIAAYTGLQNPAGVFVDNAGNLFVSDNSLDQVLEYPKGSTSSTDGTVVVSDELVDVDGVGSVVLDGGGNIFVQATHGNSPDSSNIYIYPSNSTAITHPIDSIRLATTPGSYEFTMDAVGNIYVTSATLGYVKKFSNVIKMTDSAKIGGTYTASVNSISGSQIVTQSVIINNLPNISITTLPAGGTICPGSDITLSGQGADSYSWSGGVSDGVAFLPSGSDTYTVTGTNTVTTCSDTVSITVQYYSLPNVKVSGGSAKTVCAGNTITLKGTGASTYVWSGGVTNGVAFAPAGSSDTYTVTGTQTVTGCSNTATATVTVNPLPTLTVVATPANATVCIGSDVTLTTTGADTYSWDGNTDVTDGLPFTPSGVSTFTVTGTNTTTGCVNTATQVVTVNNLPVVSVVATPTNSTVCAGTDVTLAGSGTDSYSWSGGLTNNVAFTATGTGTTTYTVTATNTLTTCTNTATWAETVNALPTVTAMVTPTTAVCSGADVTLTGGGADTYSWSGNVTDGVAFATSGSGPITYTVTGTSTVTTCSSTATQVVNVNALPNVSVMATPTTATVCAGMSVTLSGNGADQYSWSGGLSNGVAFAPSGTATYTVTGTNTLTTCTNTATQVVNVNTLPSVSLNMGAPLTAECTGGPTVTLSGGTPIGGIYNGTDVTAGQFNPAVTNTYIISYIYTDGNGCIDSAHQNIDVSVCTGIASVNSADGITIYPMPNNGHFTINLNGNEYQALTIYDATGKEVVKQTINGNADHVQLDLSMYADGVYFARLVSANGVTNKKIVIQK